MWAFSLLTTGECSKPLEVKAISRRFSVKNCIALKYPENPNDKVRACKLHIERPQGVVDLLSISQGQPWHNHKTESLWQHLVVAVLAASIRTSNTPIALLEYLHSSRLCSAIGQISSLQATQMTQEAAIRDLDNERNRLKDKVVRMEEEREALQSQGQALDERQKQQLQALEKVRVSVRWWSVLYSCQTGSSSVMNNQ